MRRLPLLLLVSCAMPPGAGQLETSEQPIYGGVLAPEYGQVFRIHDSVSQCTAALIAPRTLLTAQHCINVGTHFATNPPTSTDEFMSLETRTWSNVHPDGGQVDIALIWLDRAPPVTPFGWDWTTKIPPVGTVVRHIGYGAIEDGGGGERRTVVTAISNTGVVDPTSGVLAISGTLGSGACYGDSGGPMLSVTDAGERLLGVNVRLAALECGPIASVIVGNYRTFIEDWLRTHEDAGCPRDGRCVQGCAPMDVDCVCGADGVCSAACPELEDPDCPVDCRPNGVCATAACPRLDYDCTAPGEPCFLEAQCPGRQCISDPQHAGSYCSGSCDAGCMAAFECDATRGLCVKAQLPEASPGEPCTAGATLCRGSSECLDGRCRQGCTADAQCDGGLLCREPAPRYCAPVTVLPALEPEHPARPGCDATGGLMLLALLALCRPRR